MPSFRDVDDYLEDAWAELHATNDALGWFVGRPAFDAHKVVQWSLYAFDQSESAKVGKRSREWTAVAPTEIAVVRAMARCLREISELQLSCARPVRPAHYPAKHAGRS